MGTRKWVRILAGSIDDAVAVRETYEAEILRSSLRRIDSRHSLIDAFVPVEQVDKLRRAYCLRVLGDVDEMAREAAMSLSWTAPYLRVEQQ